MRTLVLQSHRTPLPFNWLSRCIDSVKAWSELNQFDYLFLNDEIFEPVPKWLMAKTQSQIVIATDVARLMQIKHYLKQGYDQVIWCDADFYIFNPNQFKLIDENFALGREIWVQKDQENKLRTYKKVHNAFLMFRQDNHFLDFYLDSALRLLKQTTGPMPPQFVGPKLLTALHNVVQCPVQESAGMLSPEVINGILHQDGKALKKMQAKQTEALVAANLCSSLSTNDEQTEKAMHHLMDALLEKGRL